MKPKKTKGFWGAENPLDFRAKRGQVSIFMIVALVILLIAGFYFYISLSSGKSKTNIVAAKVSKSPDADIVKSYAESCIRKISENALFEKIGLQGGYIGASSDSTNYLGHQVPYFLQGIKSNGVTTYNSNIPTLNFIKNNLASHIEAEFENCFKPDVFSQIGLKVVKTGSIKADVGSNEGDISVKINYPLIIHKEKAETKIDSFSVILPIRLKSIYDSAASLVEKAKNSQPNQYNIGSDCGELLNFDKDKLTNIYLRTNNDGSFIVQYVDFSTYHRHYFNSYFFQFAAKNVNIAGECVGS